MGSERQSQRQARSHVDESSDQELGDLMDDINRPKDVSEAPVEKTETEIFSDKAIQQ